MSDTRLTMLEMTGQYFRLQMDEEGFHLLIIPEEGSGLQECLAGNVATRAEMEKILKAIEDELYDLRYKLEYEMAHGTLHFKTGEDE